MFLNISIISPKVGQKTFSHFETQVVKNNRFVATPNFTKTWCLVRCLFLKDKSFDDSVEQYLQLKKDAKKGFAWQDKAGKQETERIDENVSNIIVWACSCHETKARKQGKTDKQKQIRRKMIERERKCEKGEWKHRETLKNQRKCPLSVGNNRIEDFPETKKLEKQNNKKTKQTKTNREGFGGGPLTWPPPKQRRETKNKPNKKRRV